MAFYLKLARGNVVRSLRDYSVYFAALMLATCLMYAFNSSTDYLLALDLTERQRALYANAGSVVQAFSVLVVVVFIFLVRYANRFIVRRRKREFGLYILVGMGSGGIACVLTAESGLVGLVALALGIGLGVMLSPLFGAVAAFVFDAPWRFGVTFSPQAALWTVACFAVVFALGAVAAARDVLRRPLVTLMDAERTPERPHAARAASCLGQVALAMALLVVVWGSCVLYPEYFIVFIIPMGFAAYLATRLVFNVLGAALPACARKRPRRYWRGLAPFTWRQLEARSVSGGGAMACACVLVAAGVCLVCAGFSFSVGMRGPDAAPESAFSYAPIGYVGIFFGATFLVAAAAILALQQLSAAADERGAYLRLWKLGCERSLMRTSFTTQIRMGFAQTVAFALVHDLFGLVLVAMLAEAIGAAFTRMALAAVAGTLLFMMACYLVTRHACEQVCLPRR